LRVSNKGLDWQYVEASGTASTDETCPGARRFPFVVGYAPAYAPCAPPAVLPEGEGDGQGDGETQGGGWRSWFGMERKQDAAPEPAQSAPAATPPAR